MVHNPKIGSLLSRNAEFNFVLAGDFRTKISTNSFGFRDKEYSLDKSEGVHRILVLGDSKAFGYGVDLQNSFPKVLENLLNNSRLNKKKKFEVINAGIPGHGIYNMSKLFEFYGVKFKPDLTILTIEIFDITGTFSRIASLQKKTSSQNVSLLKKIKVFLYNHTATYVFLEEKFDKLLKNLALREKDHSKPVDSIYLSPLSDDDVKKIEDGENEISRIRQLCESMGSKYLVVVIPREIEIDRSRLSHYRQIGSAKEIDFDSLESSYGHLKYYLDSNDINYLFVYEALRRKVEKKEQLFFKRNSHYNKIGNYYIAQEIFEYLNKKRNSLNINQ
ncbi:SGNH/GDSL hydrolase family protein [Candidatus Omnitrophota bacterium]